MRIPPKNLRAPPAFEAKLEMYGGHACLMLRHHEQVWQIVCVELMAMQLGARIELASVEHVHDRGHVLLQQFRDDHVELYFRGTAQDTSRLIGDLWMAHRRVAAGWIPFERYFNGLKPLHELVAAGFGSLAEGPRFLLDAYADVLQTHGMAADLTDSRDDGRARGPQPEHALVFDRGYIVARDFDASGG